jgi:hypothetical protein
MLQGQGKAVLLVIKAAEVIARLRRGGVQLDGFGEGKLRLLISSQQVKNLAIGEQDGGAAGALLQSVFEGGCGGVEAAGLEGRSGGVENVPALLARCRLSQECKKRKQIRT